MDTQQIDATASTECDEQTADSVLRERVRAGEFDFIDFGSSAGGSIDYCMRRFNAKCGLGLDLGAKEVEMIRARGFDAIQGDALKFECPPAAFRFVSMMDFLEHLPDAGCVERALATAQRVARDFIFIRHPAFEDEPYLNSVGLKQYWTDWKGHQAKITVAEFAGMFDRLGLQRYCLRFRQPASDSNDAVMLPAAAPPDQHHYEKVVHGPKPAVVFPRPIYGQIDMFVALRDFDADEWNRISARWD